MKTTITTNKYLKDITFTIDNYNRMLKEKYSDGEYSDEDEEELFIALETMYKMRKLLEKA